MNAGWTDSKQRIPKSIPRICLHQIGGDCWAWELWCFTKTEVVLLSKFGFRLGCVLVGWLSRHFLQWQMVAPPISWWFLLSPWVVESGSVETGGLTCWLHYDDQVSTGLRNNKYCRAVSVLETAYLSRILTTLYIGCI